MSRRWWTLGEEGFTRQSARQNTPRTLPNPRGHSPVPAQSQPESVRLSPAPPKPKLAFEDHVLSHNRALRLGAGTREQAGGTEQPGAGLSTDTGAFPQHTVRAGALAAPSRHLPEATQRSSHAEASHTQVWRHRIRPPRRPRHISTDQALTTTEICSRF